VCIKPLGIRSYFSSIYILDLFCAPYNCMISVVGNGPVIKQLSWIQLPSLLISFHDDVEITTNLDYYSVTIC